jgi:chloramphenicol O-acetyltransferase type A
MYGFIEEMINMKFKVINLNKWPRKTHFEFFTHEGESSYNLTYDIDITHFSIFLKNNHYKFFPAFLYAVAKAINKIKNFKIRLNEAGKLGYWDYISPSYNIFHKDDNTFSCIYTEYTSDFFRFYKAVLSDIKKYQNKKGVCTRKSPKNCFCTSCIPWLAYSGFSLQLSHLWFLPIVTWGKYFEKDDRLYISITLQAHHAIADGYHACQFVNQLQKIVSNPKQELRLKQKA